MVEAIATLLNTLVQRVLFNHMTMFLFFLFVSFYFMPPDLAADMNAKTPAFFPDWFTLSTFGSIIFTCFATMAWILFERFLKWLWQIADNYFYPRFRRRKVFMAWEATYQTLSDEEISTIRKLFVSGGAPVELPPDKTTELLISKNIIQLKLFNPLFRSFILTPSFNLFFKEKVSKGMI